MYIYFDSNGTLKEIITERPFRVGDVKRNKIYVYWDGEHAPASGWVKYRKPDGTDTTETSFFAYGQNLVEKELPQTPVRNLKYFSYDHTYVKNGETKVGYQFYEITVPNEVLNSSSDNTDLIPTENNMVVARIRFVMVDSGTIGEIDDSDTIETLGAIVFSVETNMGIITDSSIDETQYNYLLWAIGNKVDTSAFITALNNKADRNNPSQTIVADRIVTDNITDNEDSTYGLDILENITSGSEQFKFEYMGELKIELDAGLQEMRLNNGFENTGIEIGENIKLNAPHIYNGSNQELATQNYVQNYVNSNVGTATQNALDLKVDKSSIVDNTTTNDATKVLSAKQGKVLRDDLGAEITNRQSADNNLQSQIDGINAGQNLADIVTDLTALGNLDTTKLQSGDKVEVLSDSNHDNVSTVYNWNGTAFVYIGAYGMDSYTKAQMDTYLAAKQDKIDSSHKLSSDLVDDTGHTNKFVTQAQKVKIDNAYGPSYVGEDTSTNILAKGSNTGIWKATDNGHWYYWNGSAYVDGGVYQTDANYDIIKNGLFNDVRSSVSAFVLREDEFEYESKGVVATTGALEDSTYYVTHMIPLCKGFKVDFKIYQTGNSKWGIIEWYDTNGENAIPLRKGDISIGGNEGTITIENDGFIRVMMPTDWISRGLYIRIYNLNGNNYIKDYNKLWNENEIIAYFSYAGAPTFTQTSSDTIQAITGMTITFPSNREFRLYKRNGETICNTSAFSGQTYTLANLQKLVYDLDDNSIYVVPTSSTSSHTNSIVLFELGYGFSGVLAKFYYRRLFYDNNFKIQNLDYKIEFLQWYTEANHPIYYEEDTTNNLLYVMVSEIYGRVLGSLVPAKSDVTAYRATILSNIGQTAVTSPNGVENCFTISGGYNFVYSLTDNQFHIKSRTSPNMNDVILIMCLGGRLIYIKETLLAYKYLDFIYPEKMEHYLEQQKYIKSVAYSADFKFLFFSDIHGAKQNMARIVKFGNLLGSTNLNAIINGGDTVTNYLEDSFGYNWYNDLADESDVDVLTCIGNHDEWLNDYYVEAPATDIYNAFIAPTVERVSNIVQPTNASTNGYCYYYKDYNNIRVIVLDAMDAIGVVHWDTNQQQWFENVLADARTNNKSVICVNHTPFSKTDVNVVRDENSGWNSWKPFSSYDGSSIPTTALDKVQAFITAGGTFICWLTGHTHFDNLLTNTSYSGQLMFSIATAKNSNHSVDGAVITDTKYGMYDCFNYFGIDTTNHFIKVWRVGYNIDGGMKERNVLCYNYQTQKIVFED